MTTGQTSTRTGLEGVRVLEIAGGLGPENVARALAVSGARWIDVNSGVESAPGVKDAAKIRQLATSIRQHASGGNAPPF